MISINTLSLFFKALYAPQKLTQVAQLKKSKSMLYLFILILFASLPFVQSSIQLLDQFETDSQTILEHIPDFTVKDDVLVPKKVEKSFVYQTNSILFTFDPNNTRKTSDIDSDAIKTSMAIALFSKEIYVVVQDRTFSFDYHQLGIKTQDDFKAYIIQTRQLKVILLVVVVILSVLISAFFTGFYSILYMIATHLIVTLMKRSLSYGQSWKIGLVASTLPIVGINLINFLGVLLPFQMEIELVLTMIIAYQMIKAIPSQATKP
ncbi:DUF1189 family protein [Isobaculum melis]|uniref:Maltodextrin utilization protein YvdJ n=1 Tax=Isobaculum melis TaxID=142588 RepID=A0A1H9RTC5_9LACT|nr:DUF1189 family protein [Isobaculum melis]SER75695.1 Protein of unknown function [Isobaculum melis]